MKNVRFCSGENTKSYCIEVDTDDPDYNNILFKQLAKLVKKRTAKGEFVSALHGPVFLDGDSVYVIDVHFSV